MKNSLQICAWVLVLLIPMVVSAEKVRMCFRFNPSPEGYSDSSASDDYLTEPEIVLPPGETNPNRPGLKGWTISGLPTKVTQVRKNYQVQGSHVIIDIKNYSLDEFGCLPLLDFTTQDYFQFEVKLTISGSNGRRISVLSSSSTNWGDVGIAPPQRLLRTIQLTNSSYATPVYLNIQPSDVTNLLPMMHRLITDPEQFGFPQSSYIHIATGANKSLCNNPDVGAAGAEPTFKYIGGHKLGRICVYTDFDQKFVLSHEIGHLMANLNDMYLHNSPGDNAASYDAGNPGIAVPANSRCMAVDQQGTNFFRFDGNDKYRMHSREWVGTAASEGWAQFISATFTYDKTNSDTGVPIRGTYGDSTFYTTVGGDGFLDEQLTQWELKSRLKFIPYSDYDAEAKKWTQRFCAPPAKFAHLGTVRDWQRFFWNLYAADNEDLQFSVQNIAAIWNAVDDNWSTANNSASWPIYKYCAPITGPEGTGESGWSCQNEIFSYYQWYNACPTCTPGVVRRYAVKRKHGKTWSQVRNSVKAIWEEANEDKYRHFLNTGDRAGVVFK